MPIVESKIRNSKKQAVGYRVSFEYIFSDGRSRVLGPAYVSSLEEATVLLEKKMPSVQQSIIDKDTLEAISREITTPYKEASQKDIYFGYLNAGYLSDDPIESLNLMSAVADQVLSLGLSNEYMAAMFDQPIETVENVLARWEFLQLNKDIIVAYDLVLGRM